MNCFIKIKSACLLFIILGFLFSCKKEFSNNGNKSPINIAGARASSGTGKNYSPVANAGVDQTITLPLNTITLDGGKSTDPNNNITGYQWTEISGPSSFTIANANAVQTQVTNLVPGIYQFELKVTDARGLLDKDTTQVTVMMNLPPSCTNCKIVFVSDRDGNDEIYSCNADSSNVTRLTNDPAADGQPDWSPDGTRIAFIRYTGMPIYGMGNLFTMNADGSNLVQRTFTWDADNPAWSPDGTRIAFTSYGSVFLMNVASGAVSEVPNTAGDNAVPHSAWSPDGTKIAFESEWNPSESRTGIFTVSPDGNGRTLILYGDSYYWRPAWSPDGTKLSVAIRMGSMDNGSIGVMNPNGTGLSIIRSGIAMPTFSVTRTSWSPDGKGIVYTDNKTIKWVAADGSAAGTIIANGWDADWK